MYALNGQWVAVLRQGSQKAGYHQVHWDGRDQQERPLASGIYLCRLVTAARKLMLLR